MLSISLKITQVLKIGEIICKKTEILRKQPSASVCPPLVVIVPISPPKQCKGPKWRYQIYFHPHILSLVLVLAQHFWATGLPKSKILSAKICIYSSCSPWSFVRDCMDRKCPFLPVKSYSQPSKYEINFFYKYTCINLFQRILCNGGVLHQRYLIQVMPIGEHEQQILAKKFHYLADHWFKMLNWIWVSK